MPRVSDLVLDAELETLFHSDYTIHTHTESGLNEQERSTIRAEYWKRQKRVGRGSFGCVWLEQCMQGQGEIELRAVKEVIKCPHATKKVDYNRELETILKFSHRKVPDTPLKMGTKLFFS